MSLFSKIKAILTPVEHRGALVLFLLVLVGTLLETLGVGLVIPAIALMMQDDLAARYPVLAPIILFMGSPSQAKLIIISMAVLVGIYFVKNLFLAFLSWRQVSYTFDVQANLSLRLFTAYLHQPYTFHLQRNSAQLVRNVNGEVALFSGVMTSLLMLITELMVLVAIAILLFFVEPMGALIATVVLGCVAWGFHRLTRERISHWGAERQIHEGQRYLHLQQGLGGAKDVKMLGRESDFLKKYSRHNIQSARMWKRQSTLQSLPRLMLEFLAVVGLAILVLTMLVQGRDMMSIIPTLGLFAAAAFRLMPSVNRILNAVQTLRYSLPAVNTLYNEINLSTSKSDGKEKNAHYIGGVTLTEVSYIYPGAKTFALEKVSLDVTDGECVGFIGSSGSGKSTLIDVILGLLTPDGGKIMVGKEDIQSNLRAWQDQIGYVPQSIYLTDDTLRRNIAFGLPDDQIDEAAISRAVCAAQLNEFIASLDDGLETVVGERGVRLSGGQRQRIGIARSLYHDPSVLVLDEATSALDGETENSVMDAIMALHGKKTIIIVAHRLSTVERCDKVYRLDKGRVVNGGVPSEVIPAMKESSQS